jgi:hypothetical protein
LVSSLNSCHGSSQCGPKLRDYKSVPPNPPKSGNPLDPVFLERERNRFGARALGFLTVLNGVAALVLLAILGKAPPSTVDGKVATAMLFFGGGAIAALLSSFLAYINRTVAMEAPKRADLRRALQILAIAAVIGSAAAFLTGMNMVRTAASERSSSHPKGPKEETRPDKENPNKENPKKEKDPVLKPSERVELMPTKVTASSTGLLDPGQNRKRGLRRSSDLAGEIAPHPPQIDGEVAHPVSDHGPVHHAAPLQRVGSGVADIGGGDREQNADDYPQKKSHPRPL